MYASKMHEENKEEYIFQPKLKKTAYMDLKLELLRFKVYFEDVYLRIIISLSKLRQRVEK
jgi:hypothetical protein